MFDDTEVKYEKADMIKTKKTKLDKNLKKLKDQMNIVQLERDIINTQDNKNRNKTTETIHSDMRADGIQPLDNEILDIENIDSKINSLLKVEKINLKFKQVNNILNKNFKINLNKNY